MITNRGKDNQKVFVLDSKYYRYGETKNPNHLPDSSSVVKQIAYAQYIENPEKNTIPEDVKKYTSNNQIYNAFILPGKKMMILKILDLFLLTMYFLNLQCKTIKLQKNLTTKSTEFCLIFASS